MNLENSTVVPVIIITGFLGSGKTSLIAGQLDDDKENKLSVIVHDLGDENIDVAFLQGGEHVALSSNKQIRSVASGYLTDKHLDELKQELDSLATQESKPRAILLETSGAANVIPVVNELRAGGAAWKLISIVTVVDASVLGDYHEDPMISPLLEAQALSASLLILNKWDRSKRPQRKTAKSFAASICERNGALAFTTSFGQIDIRDLLLPRQIPDLSASESGKLETSIESVHLMQRRPFHPERLERWLNESWSGIIRVKGFVWLATDMQGIYVLDAAGSQREVGLEGTWYASVADEELKGDPEVQELVRSHPWGDRRQALTIIGRPSSVASAREKLEAALLGDEEMTEGPEVWKTFADPLTIKFNRRNRH